MKTISLIIPTLGMVDLDDTLGSLYNIESPSSFDEIIVCVDMEGRSKITKLDRKADVSVLRDRYPKARWIENNEKPWEMMNQTMNIAIRNSTSEYIFITHDDCYFPCFTAPVGGRENFDFAKKAREELEKLIYPQIGVSFNFINMINFLDTRPRFGETTSYTPISSVIPKDFIEQMGYFNTSYGVYYDVLISRQMAKRGTCCKMIHDAPCVFHKVSKSYQITDNYGGYQSNIKWSTLEENYKKYTEDTANEVAVPYNKLTPY